MYIYSMINNPFCFKNIRASILLFNVHDDLDVTCEFSCSYKILLGEFY